MQETQAMTEFAVGFADEAQWSEQLADDYHNYRHAGWQFVTTLQTGIDQLSKRKDISALYDTAHQETGLSKKRLMNLVSMAHNPASRYAAENGLEIAHAEAVAGLPESEAIAYLDAAIAEGKSARAIGAMIRDTRQARTANPNADLPDVGNENNLHDVPFDHTKSNILYDDDDYSAEASAYAGGAAGYEFDDDVDDLELTINEARNMIDAAWQRLARADVGHQYTLTEWAQQLLIHAY